MRKTVAKQFDEDDYDRPGLLSAFARRPVDTLAGALAAACTVMILVNALALQTGEAPEADRKRPVSESAAAPKADAPKRSELVTQVQTALAERELYDGVVDGLMGSATAAAIRAFEQSQGMAATGEASEKVLAALLTAPMGQRPAAQAPAKPAARPAAQAAASQATPSTTGSTASADSRLMAVQKALARIGYGPVSVDGKMGTETRNAIKAFERDRNLPETGDLSPQTLRALQGLTGASLH